MQRERDELVDGPYRRDFLTYDNHILDGDIFLQALNGFLIECLNKDITIKNVVTVFEKISSVGSVDQLDTFLLTWFMDSPLCICFDFSFHATRT